MKKHAFYIFTIVFVAIFATQFAAAQFNIKIPKINKPKVEKPKDEVKIKGEIMRNKKIEITDKKGQRVHLQISTVSTLGKAKDTLAGADSKTIKAKLTGWDKHTWTFENQYPGDWKSMDVVFCAITEEKY